MQKRLLEYLKTQLSDDENHQDLEADSDLLGEGILDSLGMVKFIAFVESEFEIVVAPEDMVIENFMSINNVSAYVNSKLQLR